MSNSNGILVRANNVHKVFHRGTEEIHVLSGLNLEVPEGEFVALAQIARIGAFRLNDLIED